MKIFEEKFGSIDGNEIKKIILKNDSGIKISLINYGAVIQSIILPDRFGEFSEISRGYETLEEYVNDTEYTGATVGRFANRIKDGSFSVDGEKYQLSKNENGKNHLHGGFSGFNKKIWSYEAWSNKRIASVRMKYISPDGDEGFPGNLNVETTFTLDEKDSFIINYRAESDKKTPINLTNHAYMNFSGIEHGKTVLGHMLQVNSGFYIETDDEMIPTGRILDVKDGPMNFKEFRRIGERIKETGAGYDHCFVFPSDRGNMYHALTLYDPLSGRKLDVFTDNEAVQVYTANHSDPPHCAVCFETQNFPDSVNKPDFPDPFISPGEVYNRTVFCRFTISDDCA